jgi:hypothetical protein
MSNYLKGSLKVFFRYGACLLFVAIFGIAVFKFKIISTLLVFFLMFFLIYGEMNGFAIHEKKPVLNIKSYPLKGLVYGILGFLPFIIITVILLNIKFASPIHGESIKINYNQLKHSIQMALLSPLYIPLRIGKQSIAAYIISLAIVPLISGAGYLTGYYGFEFKAVFRKFKKNKAPEAAKKTGGRNVR